ncbi:MAG: SDR family oxidoreductase [Acidimicrobiales bacterium]|nr:SDR family oxidoreductase [Acidimicrobiales bacterium]
MPTDRSTRVGPFRIEIIEPMQKLRIVVDDNEHGIAADLTFVARTVAVEEPRQFKRLPDGRLLTDHTRMTQWGAWEGVIRIDGDETQVDPATTPGTKDRSWGVRPVGEATPTNFDSGMAVPQAFWLWAPLHFEDRHTHLALHEHPDGSRWLETALVVDPRPTDAAPWQQAGLHRCEDIRYEMEWRPGRREIERAALTFRHPDDGELRIELERCFTFHMRGIGYLHPEWGHGRSARRARDGSGDDRGRRPRPDRAEQPPRPDRRESPSRRPDRHRRPRAALHRTARTDRPHRPARRVRRMKAVAGAESTEFPSRTPPQTSAARWPLVTGASSGLGWRFSRVLAAAGATVAVAARREDRLEELCRSIGDTGGTAFPIRLDVTDVDSIIEAVAAAEDALGTVTTLVNNAGIPDAQRAHKMPVDLIDRVLDTNLRGPYILACEVARRLMAADLPGRIVNISSVGARQYSGGGAALYSITKAGIERMTEVLAVEWARKRINVNAIAPGAFSSEMMDGMLERIGDMSAHFPRKRLGDPAQLDSTLLFLVAPASEFVTGTVVTVDDGQSPR